MTMDQVLGKVAREVERAVQKHGDDRWVRHQFYGILLEEVDELWEVIKRDGPQADLEAEAVQVAAVIVRYLATVGR